MGESGCGKSVSTKSIMRLHDEKHTRYSGQILFKNGEGKEVDVLSLSEKQMQTIQGKDIAMIFQDPMTSLEKVGILPAEQRYEQYPFEMSGGMLQRVMIAMALSCKPRLLIADEPTTALDVTIQAQILKLIKELAAENNTSVIFITHNLGVVAEICDSVSVMYAGRICETGSVLDIFDNAAHPYTRALLNSNPKEADTGKYMATIPGAPPLLYNKFTHCPFAERCDKCMDKCRKEFPTLKTIRAGHKASCFLSDGGEKNG